MDPGLLENARVGGHVQLTDTAAKHFIKILRLKENHQVELFDGQGKSAFGMLQETGSARHAFVQVTHIRQTKLPPLPPISIAHAWTKPSKAEEVVQHGTELGASQFLFFNSYRTSCKSPMRGDRLQSIAIDAARQSGRIFIPSVLECLFLSLQDSFEKSGKDFKGIKTFGSLQGKQTLSQTLQSQKELLCNKGVMIFVGPEGGWEEYEEEYLIGQGVIPVRMGEYVLRTETAPLAALTTVQCVLNKM